jgi:hypothetical protein
MNNIAELLEKPMDRKDFLRHMGLGAVMLLGGNMVLKGVLAGTTHHKQNLGYGTSPYGGAKK